MGFYRADGTGMPTWTMVTFWSTWSVAIYHSKPLFITWVLLRKSFREDMKDLFKTPVVLNRPLNN
ncbi:hypothetical protein HanRHA438_Chr04g0177001 [Helianthus annuus]|nr:hypothetical protein HanRHA438_Chr04g0177001 [Helianthus annuus]